MHQWVFKLFFETNFATFKEKKFPLLSPVLKRFLACEARYWAHWSLLTREILACNMYYFRSETSSWTEHNSHNVSMDRARGYWAHWPIQTCKTILTSILLSMVLFNSLIFQNKIVKWKCKEGRPFLTVCSSQTFPWLRRCVFSSLTPPNLSNCISLITQLHNEPNDTP